MSGKLPGADGAVGCVAAEVSPAEPVAARGGGGGGKVTVGIGGGGGGATGATGGGAATDAAGTAAKGAGGIVAAGVNRQGRRRWQGTHARRQRDVGTRLGAAAGTSAAQRHWWGQRNTGSQRE